MAKFVVFCLAMGAAFAGFQYGVVFEHAREYKKPPKEPPTIRCNERGRATWLIDCIHAAASPAYCEQRAADIFCTTEE